MSFKDLFLIVSKNDYQKELKKKLTSLEMNIEELKESILTFQEQKPKEMIGQSKEPPIIIEKINIEKIIIDKYELNNNFGQLGIKELKGKLNIGATYGSEFIPKVKEEEEEERRTSREKTSKEFANNGPKINIKTKNDEEKKD